MRRPQKESSNDPTRNQDHIPLSRDHIDVVISNCVINLSVDKPWPHQRGCCPGPPAADQWRRHRCGRPLGCQVREAIST
jgi:hypothetical protein